MGSFRKTTENRQRYLRKNREANILPSENDSTPEKINGFRIIWVTVVAAIILANPSIWETIVMAST
jgi:hypothetical protein